MLTRERIRELIDQHGLSDRADEIMAEVRPSIHLTLRYDVDEADIPIGASKMGGSPDVPEGFEFPMWNGQYLSFIAQIRLSDAKPYDLEDLLPAEGMLYFFCEFGLYLDEPYGKALHSYCVLYLNDETVSLKRMQQPISKFLLQGAHPSETLVYEACLITFQQEWTPASLYHPSSKQAGGIETQKDLAWKWFLAAEKQLARPMHRLLGVETDIQWNLSMMEDASKAWDLGTGEDWTLLLQVDNDDWDTKQHKPRKPGFAWGDLGLLYFCIHKDDLRTRRFDRVWLYFTSY